MINGWQTVPLGEFLAQRKEFFTIDDFSRYKRARVQSHGKGIVLRDEVDGIEIKTKKQQAARTGEFLVAEIDAKVGGFGIVPPELDGAVVSSHYFLFQINEKKCLKSWLNWFVRYNSLEDQVKAQGSTNYAAIRPSHVLNFEIPLPSLDEQYRIAERVEALAARIKKAQFLRNEASKEIDLLFFKTSKRVFEEVSNTLTTIGKAFRVSTGGTPSRSNPSYWGGDVKWVSSGEVAFSQITDTKEKITKLGVSESNAKVYPPHTVLIAMIGQGKTRGQCAILDCYAATNQNVAGIHVYETEHLPKYVYWWLRSRYLESRLSETGTAQPALSGERVKQMPIPLPPRDEQRRIVAYLDSVQARLRSLRELQSATGEEMDALLPSVLDKAFKGEL